MQLYKNIRLRYPTENAASTSLIIVACRLHCFITNNCIIFKTDCSKKIKFCMQSLIQKCFHLEYLILHLKFFIRQQCVCIPNSTKFNSTQKNIFNKQFQHQYQKFCAKHTNQKSRLKIFKVRHREFYLLVTVAPKINQCTLTTTNSEVFNCSCCHSYLMCLSHSILDAKTRKHLERFIQFQKMLQIPSQ
eukprot:TRINITY_DN35502_c0_g1_i1.p1 TRINITY_DN35502_c0_g1~~TRINITY_DN35502_c0_g1_i1.p1  ORF type:complete len:189 (-),score=-23.51 TRINITY_DN35502_c0_g1_i1:4-570(-)